MLKNFLIVVVYVLAGCSSLGALDSGNAIEFSQDVTVKEANKEAQKFAKGSTMPLSDQAVLVEAPGHISMLIIPKDNAKNITINLKTYKNWGGSAFQEAINLQVNTITARIIDIEQELQKRNYSVAMNSIDNLLTQFPEISYLHFLKASCLVLQGKNDIAIKSLEKALNDFPGDTAGNTLFLSLTGKEFRKDK